MAFVPPRRRQSTSKDDLEHLSPIDFDKACNLVVRPPARPGVAMTNGPRRVVLITGASSGIGRATAELLAARGHRVFGGVRSTASTRSVAGVELVPLDVRDEVSVNACVDEVRSRAGRIDVLINNAGVNLVGAVEETSISQAQTLFDTNVIGVLRMIQAVLPGMRRQGTGLIVNISSVVGFLPAPFMGVYASTKHAIEGLSESLAHEVRAFGIRVVLIEPHYVRTNLDASAAQAEGRIDAYAAQRQRTAAVIRHDTNTAPEPKLVAEEVLRSIEGPYRMRRPVGRAVLLSRLRRLMPARLFEPGLRKAYALDPSNKGAAVTQPGTQP
jgi:NAD(P)-dependent dehydrogenase (short-subunit alcohol dehydrogenase family)